MRTIGSASRSPAARRARDRQSSSSGACGNFGARAEAAVRRVERRAQLVERTLARRVRQLRSAARTRARGSRARASARSPCSAIDVALLAIGARDVRQQVEESRAGRSGRPSGNRCRAKNGSPCGVRNIVSGQPPRAPRQQRVRRLVDLVEVRPLLAIDLDVDEVLVHRAPRRPDPRTIRAPSRGTSGTRSSRSTAGSACPPRARARAPPRPTDTSRPDCPRAAAGTGSFRPRGGSARTSGRRPRALQTFSA